MRLFNLLSDPKEETDIKDANPWVQSVDGQDRGGVHRDDPALSSRAAQRAGSVYATEDIARIAVERREFIAMLASTPGVSIPSDADAQPAAPAAAPKPLSITLLGTGTPAPSLERQSSGYLIEVGTTSSSGTTGPARTTA